MQFNQSNKSNNNNNNNTNNTNNTLNKYIPILTRGLTYTNIPLQPTSNGVGVGANAPKVK